MGEDRRLEGARYFEQIRISAVRKQMATDWNQAKIMGENAMVQICRYPLLRQDQIRSVLLLAMYLRRSTLRSIP